MLVYVNGAEHDSFEHAFNGGQPYGITHQLLVADVPEIAEPSEFLGNELQLSFDELRPQHSGVAG